MTLRMFSATCHRSHPSMVKWIPTLKSKSVDYGRQSCASGISSEPSGSESERLLVERILRTRRRTMLSGFAVFILVNGRGEITKQTLPLLNHWNFWSRYSANYKRILHRDSPTLSRSTTDFWVSMDRISSALWFPQNTSVCTVMTIVGAWLKQNVFPRNALTCLIPTTLNVFDAVIVEPCFWRRRNRRKTVLTPASVYLYKSP